MAPSQFECAPIFEEISVAVDHNTLLMDIMDRVARRHKLRALLHDAHVHAYLAHAQSPDLIV